jgi:hypothetical protein
MPTGAEDSNRTMADSGSKVSLTETREIAPYAGCIPMMTNVDRFDQGLVSNTTAGVSDSGSGQSRRLYPLRATSDLPRSTDCPDGPRLVNLVPTGDIA